MTEEEWLRSQDPAALWRFLEVTDPQPPLLRKSRLLACGMARLAWHVYDDHGKRIIESMERYADGHESLEEFSALMGGYWDQVESEPDQWRQAAGNCILGLGSARHDNYPLRFAITEGKLALAARQQNDDVWKSNQIPQICEVVRDVFGNPFRPVEFEPSWKSEETVEFARDMYESRDFSPMPKLIELLRRAGCRDTQVLAHCHDGSSHVRGCWVVDHILDNA